MKKFRTSDLTIEEKLALLAGKDEWHTEDLGGKLYEVTVSDGPLGVRKPARSEDGEVRDLPSVAYPSAQVLAQTFSPELARRMGQCLADDCIEKDVDVLLAPGVNIKRSPLCGRNFEYFSEDPYLAGVFGREYIAGVQSGGVGTSLKHFCANNSEYGRVWISSEADERTLREIYLRPFEIACEADPASVMCSYNLVNGVRMSEHKKLYRLLRETFWREDGLIISDWGAVQDRAASLRAGLDVEMPFSQKGSEDLRAAYRRGEISDEQIDRSVERVLKFVYACEERKKLRKVASSREERLNLAQEVAEEGIVLLKNNGILPIQSGASVSLSAEHVYAYISGGGSSRVVPDGEIAPLREALTRELPASEIAVAGVWDGAFTPSYTNAYGKEVAIVLCGVTDSEGDDRKRMTLPENDVRLIRGVARLNPNTVVVLRCGAAVDVSEWIGEVAAVVSAGYGGQRGNEALAGVLSGRICPSGRLAETWANRYDSYPVAHQYADHRVSVYGEGLSVGYRYFDDHPEEVRFPFGYGLSYASFEYSALLATPSDEGVTVKFRIRNTSEREGAEVAQLYVREVCPCVYRPQKELKGFRRVFLKAGEEREVTIELPRSAFAYWSVSLDEWTVSPGKFEILIGKNAQDILLKTVLVIE